MALKDLVAEKSMLAERAIEDLVRDFVRYDPNERAIAFTPEFALRSNKARVLIYLVALQGWPYVLEEAVPTGAKPSAIERDLGIPGGTLRPILKDLKDRHIVHYRDGEYSARTSSLSTVRSEIGKRDVLGGGGEENPAKPSSVPGSEASGRRAASARRRSSPVRSRELSQKFNQWVEDGFFDPGKSLGDVQARFHAEAVIIPQTSIPKYLLAAVRQGRLTRGKEIVGGKERWIYRTTRSSDRP